MEIILQFIQDQPWFSVVTATISLASAITALTPTPKEGSILSYVYKVIEILALNILKAKNK